MLRTHSVSKPQETTADSVKLSPTQGLILDLLAARTRTGETLWTFDSRLSKQIGELADLGLVNSMHGAVERTVRASLTTAGQQLASSSTYVSPIEQDLTAARTEIRVLRQAIERGAGS